MRMPLALCALLLFCCLPAAHAAAWTTPSGATFMDGPGLVVHAVNITDGLRVNGKDVGDTLDTHELLVDELLRRNANLSATVDSLARRLDAALTIVEQQSALLQQHSTVLTSLQQSDATLSSSLSANAAADAALEARVISTEAAFAGLPSTSPALSAHADQEQQRDHLRAAGGKQRG